LPPKSLIELPGFGEKDALIQSSTSIDLIQQDIEEF